MPRYAVFLFAGALHFLIGMGVGFVGHGIGAMIFLIFAAIHLFMAAALIGMGDKK